MSEATFTGYRRGKEHRESEKKEIFVNEGGTEVRKVVCRMGSQVALKADG